MSDELSKLSIDTIKYYIKYIQSKLDDIKRIENDDETLSTYIIAVNDGKLLAYQHCIKMLEDILRIEDRSQFNEKLHEKNKMMSHLDGNIIEG